MSVQTDPLPPAPDHTPPMREDEVTRSPGRFFNPVWTRWFISLRDKVNALSTSLVNLGDVAGAGIVVKDGDQWTDYWSIYLRTDEAQCVGQFTYPLVPPGYERAVTPAPDDLLRSGDVLQVEISGSGFGNATTFTVS